MSINNFKRALKIINEKLAAASAWHNGYSFLFAFSSAVAIACFPN